MPNSAIPSPEWLERANRLAIVARLLSGTLHDVNNALQVISGNAELLQMSPGTADSVTRRGQVVQAQAARARDLLAAVAEFSRDGGDTVERVGLKTTIDRALALRRYPLGKMRAAVAVEGDDVAVRASPRLLLQLALNLVMNAEVALVGQKEPRVRVEIGRRNARAYLAVEDNGSGNGSGRVLPAARAPEDPLPPMPEHRDSLGIGWLVSSRIAARLDGSLECEALEPSGLRAVLSLPASGG